MNNRIEHHYILYPNPYPTHTRLTQRWYGHSIFPLLFQFINCQSITIRSNWFGYLNEFTKSIQIANEYYEEKDDKTNPIRPYVESAIDGPKERIDKSVAYTNFEQKYDLIGEPTYELKLKRKEAL